LTKHKSSWLIPLLHPPQLHPHPFASMLLQNVRIKLNRHMPSCAVVKLGFLKHGDTNTGSTETDRRSCAKCLHFFQIAAGCYYSLIHTKTTIPSKPCDKYVFLYILSEKKICIYTPMTSFKNLTSCNPNFANKSGQRFSTAHP
jgi:hypothetical protein